MSEDGGFPREMCPICLKEKATRPSRLYPCQHTACSPCIQTWIKIGGPSCPLCKATVRFLISDISSGCNDFRVDRVSSMPGASLVESDSGPAAAAAAAITGSFRPETPEFVFRRAVYRHRLRAQLPPTWASSQHNPSGPFLPQQQQRGLPALPPTHAKRGRASKARTGSAEEAARQRLAPWLTRELQVLTEERDVTLLHAAVMGLVEKERFRLASPWEDAASGASSTSVPSSSFSSSSSSSTSASSSSTAPSSTLQQQQKEREQQLSRVLPALRPLLFGRTEAFCHELSTFLRANCQVHVYDRIVRYSLPAGAASTATALFSLPDAAWLAGDVVEGGEDGEKEAMGGDDGDDDGDVVLLEGPTGRATNGKGAASHEVEEGQEAGTAEGEGDDEVEVLQARTAPGGRKRKPEEAEPTNGESPVIWRAGTTDQKEAAPSARKRPRLGVTGKGPLLISFLDLTGTEPPSSAPFVSGTGPASARMERPQAFSSSSSATSALCVSSSAAAAAGSKPSPSRSPRGSSRDPEPSSSGSASANGTAARTTAGSRQRGEDDEVILIE